MKEEPKSIWKKSWKGPAGLLRWFLLVLAAAFLIFLCVGYESTLVRPFGKLVLFSFLFAVGWALVAVMLIAFFSWVCSWRNFKRFLFGLACVVTLIALAYAEEDLRGKLDWNSYKRPLEAQGEKFDFSDFIPPAVPDDENFAMTPIVSSSYGNLLTSDGKVIPYKDRDTNFVDRMVMSTTDDNYYNDSPTNGTGNWQTARMSDLGACQAYYRRLAARTNEFPISQVPQAPAADVLLALSKYGPTIEELRQAAQLPYSRFPENYDDPDPAEILLPHLAGIKRCSLVLQLRALAELQSNQSDKACNDVKLMFRLADSVRTEPFIITHLVRIAIIQIALQPVYEGLANHQWSDAQLAELDSELAKLDFLADYEFSIRGERASHVKIVAWLGHDRSHLKDLWGYMGNENQNAPVMALYLAPKGWFYQNDIALAKLDQMWIEVVNDEQQTVSPRDALLAGNKLNRASRHPRPYDVLTQTLVAALGGYANRVAFAQNAVNMARIGIALERFRLAQGEFPDLLDPLTPQFMQQVPHDVINGQPLHYRQTSDGQFILYSVGWNEVDDGGRVITNKYGTVDRNRGDWVWKYPAK